MPALRSTLSLIVTPTQYVVHWPFEFAHWTKANATNKHILLNENAKLKSTLLALQVKLQRMEYIEQENNQLRALLHSAQQLPLKMIGAHLLALNTESFAQQALLNKGKKDNIYVGQPVLDAYGVMGQVISVDLMTSRILLITDAKSAIPVMSVRTGLQAIAVGLGRLDKLELVNVPETVDIQEGDLFVTSGLGQRFPDGYPVGIVSNVAHIAGERFAKITIIPNAKVDRSLNVILVWVEQPPLTNIQTQTQISPKIKSRH